LICTEFWPSVCIWFWTVLGSKVPDDTGVYIRNCGSTIWYKSYSKWVNRRCKSTV